MKKIVLILICLFVFSFGIDVKAYEAFDCYYSYTDSNLIYDTTGIVFSKNIPGIILAKIHYDSRENTSPTITAGIYNKDEVNLASKTFDSNMALSSKPFTNENLNLYLSVGSLNVEQFRNGSDKKLVCPPLYYKEGSTCAVGVAKEKKEISFDSSTAFTNKNDCSNGTVHSLTLEDSSIQNEQTSTPSNPSNVIKASCEYEYNNFIYNDKTGSGIFGFSITENNEVVQPYTNGGLSYYTFKYVGSNISACPTAIGGGDKTPLFIF